MRRTPRARTDTKQMREDVIEDLRVIRDKLDLNDPAVSDAWAGIETFCSISLRIIAKTNPSKVRSEAVTTELSTLLK